MSVFIMMFINIPIAFCYDAGSGLYTAAFGVFLTFATAMLSGPADRATSSDKVALQLEQGENVVFLL
jgi:hypothetical protein